MVAIVDDPNELETQIEKELFQSGETSLNQATATTAHVTHPDAATALEILKKNFHLFREQAAKDKAEAEAYRVRIAELEKEQFLVRTTLDHRNNYNETLDRAARVTPTPDPNLTSLFPSQGQNSSVIPGGPNQIIYVTRPLTHPSFPLPAPQPSAINIESIPLINRPEPPDPPNPNPNSAHTTNPPLDMQT
ncbi:hypothetical protein ACLB2K_076837 [Fragaria x ananassa]